MKIPTIASFEEALQKDLSWRRKELSSLYLAAIGAQPGSDAQSRAARSGVVLSYAHLEGFSREAIRCYLLFVKGRFLKWSELAPNFVALKLSRTVAQGTSKPSYYRDAAHYWTSQLDEIAELPGPDAITAKSNLTFAQFSEMLYAVNIDPAPFQTKKNFFDIILLERRNAIAHGEEKKTSLEDYRQVHVEVVEIIDRLATTLVDSALQSGYRK